MTILVKIAQKDALGQHVLIARKVLIFHVLIFLELKLFKLKFLNSIWSFKVNACLINMLQKRNLSSQSGKNRLLFANLNTKSAICYLNKYMYTHRFAAFAEEINLI